MRTLFFLFFPFYLACSPWGKDADLALPCKQPCSPLPASWLAELGAAAIRFHQEIISPADGPRSHFIPSSSQYTLESMRKYGFFKGYMLGCDRLMRENNERWVYRYIVDERGNALKWDPVK